MCKSDLKEKAYQLAYDYDVKYGCCPQCVLSAVQETVGVVSDDLIRASHTFGGGGGLKGSGTCGALAGGLAALGAKFGRDRDRFGKGRFLKSFQKGKELMERFEAEYEGYTCEHIQEKYTGKIYDMWDAEGIKEFKSSECGPKCADLTGKVAVWTLELLED